MFAWLFWQAPVTTKGTPNSVCTLSAMPCQSLWKHAYRSCDKIIFLHDERLWIFNYLSILLCLPWLLLKIKKWKKNIKLE